MTLEEEFAAAAPSQSASLEEDWNAAAPSEPPSNIAVAGQSALKGLASIPDAVLNLPSHVSNLIEAGGSMALEALGDKGAVAESGITPPPSPVTNTLEQVGAISPSREPQTGFQRVLDRAIQTGVNVAVSPAQGAMAVARNAGMGAASGLAAQLTKEATGSDMAALMVGMATSMLAKGAASTANAPTLKNPVKSATLHDAQAAGYVVPPSAVKPSVTTNRLESIGGKAAIKQEAALRNQEVTNRLAAKSLNLPEETILDEKSLKQLREKIAEPYKEIDALKPPASMEWFARYHDTDRLKMVQELRAKATAKYREYDRTQIVEAKDLAESYSTQAKAIEADMMKIAQASGRSDLVKKFLEARKMMARTYDVERALNESTGNVSASVLGTMVKQGKPLTGELRVIGRFARAFPSVARSSDVVPAAGVSALEPAAGAALGMGGYAAAGPAGLAAAGLPLVRGPVRSGLLSDLYQQRLLAEPPSLSTAFARSALAGRSIADYQ